MTALPPGSLLLHVGPQKTGSTAIQMALHETRDELAAHGVLYPGKGTRPRKAGWAVLGIGSAVGRDAPRIEAWDELVAEIRDTTLPRVCLSNEDFARADDAAIERILTPLGPDRVHLVFVARRLDKLLPSHWQERVKARMTWSYADFLRHVIEDPARDWESRVMWEPHLVGDVVDRWAAHVDRDRITVIVSDEADRAVVPRAFEDLLSLPTGFLDPPPTRSNASMNYVETEAVRRLNELARDEGWTPEQYWRIIQAGAVKALKQHPTPGPSLRGLPEWALTAVADRADEQIEQVRAAGVHVVGDPERLRIRGQVEPADLPDPVTEVPLALVAEVVRGTFDGAAVLHAHQLRQARRDQRRARRDGAVSGREALGELARRARRRVGLAPRPGPATPKGDS